jgi:hypothetical protein
LNAALPRITHGPEPGDAANELNEHKRHGMKIEAADEELKCSHQSHGGGGDSLELQSSETAHSWL